MHKSIQDANTNRPLNQTRLHRTKEIVMNTGNNNTAVTSCNALAVALAAVIMAGSATAGETSASDLPRANARFAQDRVLIRFKAGASPAARAQVRNEAMLDVQEEFDVLPGLQVARLRGGENVEDVVARLSRNPNVAYVEPDYVLSAIDNLVDGEAVAPLNIPSDPYYYSLWGMESIRAPKAWDTGAQHAPNAIVAVIDSGVDFSHPDLAPNKWINAGEIPGNRVDDDRNGFIDDVSGWDFASNDNDASDCNGHGTHVAGTIAAKGDNGYGVTGVMWNTKVMPLRFLDCNGSGYTSSAIRAIQYATMMKVRVSNNSWGGGSYSQALYDAISASASIGHVFVAAAGNSGLNADTAPMYPAAYSVPNIISVAAIDQYEQKPYFSNYGKTSVDLGAPGSGIWSTVPGGQIGYMSGTSMAAPHVSGAAMLVLKKHPDWSYRLVKEAVLKSARPIAAMKGVTVSEGTLDANRAVRYTKPSKPTGLGAVAISKASVEFKWTGRPYALGYYVEMANAGSVTTPDCTLQTYYRVAEVLAPMQSIGVAHTFTATGLTAKTTYCFRVKAYNGVGVSPSSRSIFAQTYP